MQTETEETETKENRMGTQPVNGLLLRIALPLVISMLVQALYNVVDSLYVSRLSQAAFNAVSLSYPIQNIMTAIASGTGAGIIVLVSRSLGERDSDKANQFASNGVFLALCSYFVMLLFE